MFITRYFRWMRKNTIEQHQRNMLVLHEVNSKHKLLDVGCDDGAWTMQVADKIGTKKVYGMDVVPGPLKEARKNGVDAKVGNLSVKFPYPDKSFDVIHGNMLIEHLSRTEFFVQEVNRVLKPGGYCVIGTDNLASWHNIFSLIMGWMPMSNSNFSQKKKAIGNPLSPDAGEDMDKPESWQHIRVLTTIAIKDIFEINGFKMEKLLASGYYPLPNFFSKLDKRHSAFMQVKFRKVGKY